MRTTVLQRALSLGAAVIAGLCAIGAASSSAHAQAGFVISVGTPPPPLPYYDQPVVPGDDYIWQPGYWGWSPRIGYFWVPGEWVLAPEPGLLWTPGYWGWNDAAYVWYPGYWSRRVGFYGGINYGYGYFGRGYVGGGWYGNHFRYNTAVTHVNPGIVHNVYTNNTVVAGLPPWSPTMPRVSYNGGRGGMLSRPMASEQFPHERRLSMTPTQLQHERWAAHEHPLGARPFVSDRHRATGHASGALAPHACAHDAFACSANAYGTDAPRANAHGTSANGAAAAGHRASAASTSAAATAAKPAARGGASPGAEVKISNASERARGRCRLAAL